MVDDITLRIKIDEYELRLKTEPNLHKDIVVGIANRIEELKEIMELDNILLKKQELEINTKVRKILERNILAWAYTKNPKVSETDKIAATDALNSVLIEITRA